MFKSENILFNNNHDFYIIKAREFETLPVDITQHFEEVMRYGRYIMLHGRGNESK